MAQLALVHDRENRQARPAPTTASFEAAQKHVLPREAGFSFLDRSLHAMVGGFTGGLSPAALSAAYLDWAVHLWAAPGKRLELANEAVRTALDVGAFAAGCVCGGRKDPCTCALPQDNRFRTPEWQNTPYNLFAYSFLSLERWWQTATTDIRGVSKRHEQMATFAARQILDTVAPSNFILTNPQVLARTMEQRGANLLRGFYNFIDDSRRNITGQAPAGSENYQVGKTVAVTSGKVVCRTPLVEVIQYAPTTDHVKPEPIVIVPAWIMKYYILDLSPANSLVKYLVDQGYTVFMISWKNPGPEDRNLELDDYRTEGVLPAISAAIAITGADKVHAVGYCLGGTLLAITAAAMARDGDERLKSLSFFAAQTDFTEAGELMLFMDEAQLSFLEDMMWQQGYLAADKMSGAFQLLRSNDMIWSRVIHDYLMGERSVGIDIMAWNADSTRMPYRMHSEYLRSLFLGNDLAEGRFKVAGRPVTVHDIGVPIFALGTEQDHVAPWRSVYKFHLIGDTEITFALTNGGHNAGILSEPGHVHRHYRTEKKPPHAHYVDPDTWLAVTPVREGSWWTAWNAWLQERSGAPVVPPPLGGGDFPAIADAPGTYVMMK